MNAVIKIKKSSGMKCPTVLYTLYYISMAVANSIKFIISNTNQSNTYYIIIYIPRDLYSLKNEFIHIYTAKIVFLPFKPPNSFF